ncbi:hypothetical protein ACR8AL_00095 [Clavibacter sepedonicus]|nr:MULTISPECIES: hypothetical protein [Clavibacter]MBD5380520.1 hypothetical protein [Clavibacter sp.]UUK66183.1 hypothetical protein LRE50_02845 [Clavibacter sepedonicus]
MENLIGIIGVMVAFAISIYSHRQNHPKRELRYAIAPWSPQADTSDGTLMRLLVWSTGRADIPSAQFDSGHPIVFVFSAPVSPQFGVTETAPQWSPAFTSPTEFRIPTRLLRTDFRVQVPFQASEPFLVTVSNPLIDVPILRDLKAEKTTVASQEHAIQKSRARARVSLLAIASWLTAISFITLIVGAAISGNDETLGAGIGIPGMLAFPICLALLGVAGFKRMLTRVKIRRRERANQSPVS